jgi:anti-sigma factor RsiW
VVASGNRHIHLALGLYVLGSLDATDAATVERHLWRCQTCQDEFDQLVIIATYLDTLRGNDPDATTLREGGRRESPPASAGRAPSRRAARWWRCPPP